MEAALSRSLNSGAPVIKPIDETLTVTRMAAPMAEASNIPLTSEANDLLSLNNILIFAAIGIGIYLISKA